MTDDPRIRKLPDVRAFTASNGETLRTLYAAAVLRALSPAELADVQAAMKDSLK